MSLKIEIWHRIAPDSRSPNLSISLSQLSCLRLFSNSKT